LIVEKKDGTSAMSRVAILIAVDEVRPEFSQVVRSDRSIAHHTQGPRTGRSPIHQDESHVAPPNVKQNIVSDGSWRGPDWPCPACSWARVTRM
jgi:hypothetical protein